MKEILVVDGKFSLPKEHELNINKRRVHVRMAWCSQVRTLDKDLIEHVTMWFRNKSKGDKPYIPEGFIEIDKVRYKAIRKNGVE